LPPFFPLNYNPGRPEEGGPAPVAGEGNTSTSPGAPRLIAIDGPVASGKSAVGSLVARRLGYRFLDTGAMYRALTWWTLEKGLDPLDEAAVGRLARETRMSVDQAPPDSGEHCSVVVDGRDATPFLRTPSVEDNVSFVSRVPEVREVMVAQQRRFAEGEPLVMAGRDIGTVVLPKADLKVYLDASRRERARRRREQMALRGEKASLEQVEKDLARRDAIDSGREASPLRRASDAVVVNTDGLTLEETVERVLAITGSTTGGER
jgi:cytidylate kinase